MSYVWKTIHVYEVKYRSKALESRLQIVLGRIKTKHDDFHIKFHQVGQNASTEQCSHLSTQKYIAVDNMQSITNEKPADQALYL